MRWEKREEETEKNVPDKKKRPKENASDKKIPKCFESRSNQREGNHIRPKGTERDGRTKNWLSTHRCESINRRSWYMVYGLGSLYKCLANETQAVATKFKIFKFFLSSFFSQSVSPFVFALVVSIRVSEMWRLKCEDWNVNHHITCTMFGFQCWHW